LFYGCFTLEDEKHKLESAVNEALASLSTS
jgi:hypothetical protein